MGWRDDPVVETGSPEPWASDPVVGSPSEAKAGARERVQAGVSGVNKGIALLAGLPVDTIENVVNLGLAAYGASKQAITGKPGPDLIKGSFGGSESIAKGLETVGAPTSNPRPDDRASRMLFTAGKIVGGSGVPGVRAAATAAAAAGAAIAGEAGGEEWEGVGALTPSAATAAAARAKNAVAARVIENVKPFREVGADASVGQATDSAFIQGMENLAAKLPGGQGVMRKFAEKLQEDIGARTRTGVSVESAGRAIEKGAKHYVEETKEIWRILDERMARKIPQDAQFNPTNTVSVLDDLAGVIAGGERTTADLVNPKIQRMRENIGADLEASKRRQEGYIASVEDATRNRDASRTDALQQKGQLETFAAQSNVRAEAGKPGWISNADRAKEAADAAQDTAAVMRNRSGEREILTNAMNMIRTSVPEINGQVPFQVLRVLRSRIGSMLDDSLTSDIPNGQLKRLYGALTDDMREAAKVAGAEKEFNRQNRFYAARMSRIEDVLERVIGKGSSPEAIFARFMPKDPDAVTKVRNVLRSLDPAERKIVSGAVVNRLGRASPGKQDETGDVFSGETFLTNWNKLSIGAKAQLFPDKQLRQDLTAISEVVSKMREGAKSMANPSGTAGSFAAYSIYASPIAALATLSLTPLVAAGGAVAGANYGAKLLTNQKFVNWLAMSSKVSPERAPVHLTRLAEIYNSADDDEKQALSSYMQAVGASSQ